MGRLGAGRDRLPGSRHGTGGAVTEGEDVRIGGGLQSGLHHQLIERIGLQPLDAGEEIRRLDARRPDHEVGRDEVPLVGGEAIGPGLRDPLAGPHLHAEPFQGLERGIGQPVRQGREDPGGGLDDGDGDVLVRVQRIQPEGGQFACRLVQLGGQLDTGGARTGDGDAQLPALGVGLEAALHQQGIEGLRLFQGVQEDTVLLHSRDTEVVADAAHRDHQGVVGEFAAGDDQLPLLVHRRGQGDHPALPIDLVHAPHPETEVVPVPLGEELDVVFMGIEGAGRHLVQQRLPDVAQGGIDEGDVRLAPLAQPVPQAGGQLQAAGTTTDDDDTMRIGHAFLLG